MNILRYIFGVLFYGSSIYVFEFLILQYKLKEFLGNSMSIEDMFYSYFGIFLILIILFGVPLFFINKRYVKRKALSYKFNNRKEGLYIISVEEDGKTNIIYQTLFNYMRVMSIGLYFVFITMSYSDGATLQNMYMLTNLAGLLLFILLVISLKSKTLVKIVKDMEFSKSNYSGSSWSFKNPLRILFYEDEYLVKNNTKVANMDYEKKAEETSSEINHIDVDKNKVIDKKRVKIRRIK